jgi:hypothetical protein
MLGLYSAKRKKNRNLANLVSQAKTPKEGGEKKPAAEPTKLSATTPAADVVKLSTEVDRMKSRE